MVMRLYVADSGSHRIRMIDLGDGGSMPQGQITTVAGAISSWGRVEKTKATLFEAIGQHTPINYNKPITYITKTQDTQAHLKGIMGSYGNSGDNGPAREVRLNYPNRKTRGNIQ